MMAEASQIHLAKLADADALTQLVNLAYRPEQAMASAWTHESDWVSGQRINLEQMQDLMTTSNSIVLKYTQNDGIFGCVHISHKQDYAEIGMLSVHPTLQNSGIGKILLNSAEHYIWQKWQHLTHIQLSVMTVRQSLLSFYLHRGYQQTGNFFDYPVTANVGQPKTELKFEYLRKALSSPFS